jgi:hypothetical protein
MLPYPGVSLLNRAMRAVCVTKRQTAAHLLDSKSTLPYESHLAGIVLPLDDFRVFIFLICCLYVFLFVFANIALICDRIVLFVYRRMSSRNLF